MIITIIVDKLAKSKCKLSGIQNATHDYDNDEKEILPQLELITDSENWSGTRYVFDGDNARNWYLDVTIDKGWIHPELDIQSDINCTFASI